MIRGPNIISGRSTLEWEKGFTDGWRAYYAGSPIVQPADEKLTHEQKGFLAGAMHARRRDGLDKLAAAMDAAKILKEYTDGSGNAGTGSSVRAAV